MICQNDEQCFLAGGTSTVMTFDFDQLAVKNHAPDNFFSAGHTINTNDYLSIAFIYM